MDKKKILSRILLIPIMILLSSCWQKYWFDTYQVINDSEHDVTILAFWKSRDIHDSIFITNGSSYRISKDYGESHEPQGVFVYERPDSVIIKFDDGRYILQVCKSEHSQCLAEKNLIDYRDHFTVTEADDKHEGRYIYSYTITKDDYDLSKTNERQ